MCYPEKKRLAVLDDYKKLRNVSELCSKHGIARGTFYKWLQESLSERPPQPRRKPQHVPTHLLAIDSLLRQRWTRAC
ncbi:helix-turn-helix domain-containing protein [Vogesella urethralis]|uniref:helix-turn-helix domain-containing protein n=1 Tax=Vogesella urethralis TaxID=2592656 RepID=UPI001186813D|nr:helix-turn-helix domain-containing protein [Vogesella urethralis]